MIHLKDFSFLSLCSTLKINHQFTWLNLSPITLKFIHNIIFLDPINLKNSIDLLIMSALFLYGIVHFVKLTAISNLLEKNWTANQLKKRLSPRKYSLILAIRTLLYCFITVAELLFRISFLFQKESLRNLLPFPQIFNNSWNVFSCLVLDSLYQLYFHFHLHLN